MRLETFIAMIILRHAFPPGRDTCTVSSLSRPYAT